MPLCGRPRVQHHGQVPGLPPYGGLWELGTGGASCPPQDPIVDSIHTGYSFIRRRVQGLGL